MDNKRAYRRYMREVKISKRMKHNLFYDRVTDNPVLRGSLSKTVTLCSSPMCCGNKRATEGPTIQELRHDSN